MPPPSSSRRARPLRRAAGSALALAVLAAAAPGVAQDPEADAPTAAPADADVAGADLAGAPGPDAHVPELDDPPPTPSSEPRAPAPPDAAFAEVPALLDLVEGVWELDDGVGAADVPWDDYDPMTEHRPRGLMHAGVQLRVAALPGGADPLPQGPLVELGFLGDVRFSRTSSWHLRLVVAVAWQLHSEEFLGGGVSRYTSPFSVRLRLLPLAVDLGHHFALRFGPSIGVSWVPRPGSDGGAAEMFGGGSAEAVVRLLDGILEIGVVVGLQLSAYGELSRPDNWRSQVDPQGVLGGTVAVLIP